MRKFRIFDNHGITADRFTLINAWGDVYGFEEMPANPLGFGQYNSNLNQWKSKSTKHLGKQGRKFKGYHAFPVFAYIHSGVSLSLGKSEYPFTDPWDVSFKGFALIRQAKGQKMAEGLIESWNAYLSGNVYGYQVVDAMGEEMDSCWGFYGDEF